METIEQLREKQTKEIAKLEAELAIAEQAPIPPHRVSLVGTGEQAWITYKVQGIKGAMDVFSAFDVIEPFSTARDGCLYVLPESIMKESIKDKADGYYTLLLDISEGEGFGPSASLNFWARLPVGIVRVCCDITGPGYIGNYGALAMQVQVERGYGGRIVGHTYSPNTIAYSIADKTLRFAGGGDMPRFEYLFCSNTFDSGPASDMGHAVDQVMSLAEQLGE